jgi:23S rRNA (guanine745-N1)-methyltransferase
MIPDVVPYLSCPVCHGDLATAERALRCSRGHTFNIARQGYVDLSAGRLSHGGDTADMVQARAAFLADGHFAAITEALRGRARPGLAVDVGAGTGHHLAAVLDAHPASVGLALDVSKPALRRAARAHPRLTAALADGWGALPVRSGTVDTVLNVFAPRNGPEFRRILRPDGRLLVVTPTPDHLREIRVLSVDPDKEERLAATLDPHFVAVDRTPVRARLTLTRADAGRAVAMGPSARHGARPPTAELVEVTLAVDVTTYAPV